MITGPKNFFAALWPLGAVKTTAKYQHHIQRDTCRLHGCLSLASRHGPVPASLRAQDSRASLASRSGQQKPLAFAARQTDLIPTGPEKLQGHGPYRSRDVGLSVLQRPRVRDAAPKIGIENSRNDAFMSSRHSAQPVLREFRL